MSDPGVELLRHFGQHAPARGERRDAPAGFGRIIGVGRERHKAAITRERVLAPAGLFQRPRVTVGNVLGRGIEPCGVREQTGGGRRVAENGRLRR